MISRNSFHAYARNIAVDAGIMERLINDMVNAHSRHGWTIDRNGQQDLEDALRALRRVAQSIDEHLLVEKESAA
jgi:hypothetical protein